MNKNIPDVWTGGIRQASISKEVCHEQEQSRVVLAIQLEKVREENKLLISACMLSI